MVNNELSQMMTIFGFIVLSVVVTGFIRQNDLSTVVQLSNITSLKSKKPETKEEDSKLKVSEKEFCSSNDPFSLSASDVTIEIVRPLVQLIRNSTESGEILIIGIAGGSGSGKTTLANAIYERVGEAKITLIAHDSYYKDLSHLTFEEREKQNFDHPDSLDTALLVKHLKALKNKEQVIIPTYDFSTHSRSMQNKVLPPRPIILIEGILIFTDPSLYDLIDIKIFVDTDADIRLIRRIERDMRNRGRSLKSILEQYMLTVRPMYEQFVEPSKRNAHLIVPVGLNSVALDLVVSRISQSLGTHRNL